MEEEVMYKSGKEAMFGRKNEINGSGIKEEMGKEKSGGAHASCIYEYG